MPLFGKSNKLKACLGLVSVASLSVATELPFDTDFESGEGFTVGTLVSDPDWFFNAELLDVRIIDTDAASESQSLSLTGLPPFTLSATTQTGEDVYWVDFFLKPVFVPESDLPQSIPALQAAVSAFVKSGGTGTVYVVDGDGLGGGAWVSAERPLTLSGDNSEDWLRLTYRLDYASRRWDLFIDNALVIHDLGFLYDETAALNAFTLQANRSIATGFDYFYTGVMNPLFADADNDGIDDAVDPNPTVDDRAGDADGDTLSNIEEFRLGTGLNDRDSDGDQLGDAMELLWSRAPLVPESDLALLGSDGLNGLYWQTLFELAEGYALGALEGQLDWYASPNVAVTEDQTAGVTSAADEEAYVERYFGTDPEAQIWFGFTAKLHSGPLPQADTLVDPVAAVFGFSTPNTLEVLDPSTASWHAYPITSPASKWNAYAVHLDYENKRWELYQNGQLVAADLAFNDTSLSALSRFKASLEKAAGSNAASYMDLVQVYAGDDFDADGLGDDWERAYGLSPATDDSNGNGVPDAEEDLDGDGDNALAEYTRGGSPEVADTDIDYYVDQVLGDDFAYDGQSAFPGAPTATSGPKAGLAAALTAAPDTNRILIQAGSYDETTLSLAGKNLILRPNGNVSLR